MVAHNIHQHTCCLCFPLLFCFVENKCYGRNANISICGDFCGIRGGYRGGAGLTIPIELDRQAGVCVFYFWGAACR